MIVGQDVTAAMKLQDLYYGNVIPCQHDVRKDSDYAKRSLELLEMCDTLEKRLSVDDGKLLNDITDMQGMLSETTLSARKAIVSKLASVSAEQPINAAK